MTKEGLTQNLWTAGKIVISRCKHSRKKAKDFAENLKKRFKWGYPEEDKTSGVLLQLFLIRFLVPVRYQILLQPTTLTKAIKDTLEIVYTLHFENQLKPEKDINAVSWPNQMDQLKLVTQL